MEATKLPDLSRTEKAVEAYDAWFEKMVDSPADFAELDRLGREVGVAYGLDTVDRNDPKHCAESVRPGPPVASPGFGLSFVRRMLADWRRQNGR